MLATDRIYVFPLNNVPGTIVTLMDACDAVLARAGYSADPFGTCCSA
jgi:hypothetical protein